MTDEVIKNCHPNVIAIWSWLSEETCKLVLLFYAFRDKESQKYIYHPIFSRSFSQTLNLRESVLHPPPYIMKVERIKLIMLCIVVFQNLHSKELNLNVFTNKSIFDARWSLLCLHHNFVQRKKVIKCFVASFFECSKKFSKNKNRN